MEAESTPDITLLAMAAYKAIRASMEEQEDEKE